MPRSVYLLVLLFSVSVYCSAKAARKNHQTAVSSTTAHIDVDKFMSMYSKGNKDSKDEKKNVSKPTETKKTQNKAETKTTKKVSAAARKYISKHEQKKEIKATLDNDSKKMKQYDPTKGANVEQKIRSEVSSRAQTSLSNMTVRVPTSDKKVVSVSLTSLQNALNSKLPITTVQTVEGKLVSVPTKTAQEIYKKASAEAHSKAEALSEKQLMENAANSRADMDKMVNFVFKKIYKNHEAVADRKAFARVEKQMGLQNGALYSQYAAGVAVPKIPVVKQPELSTLQLLQSQSFDTINNMDLAQEQVIPESVRSILNHNLSQIEAEKEKPQTWKEYLFGK